VLAFLFIHITSLFSIDASKGLLMLCDSEWVVWLLGGIMRTFTGYHNMIDHVSTLLRGNLHVSFFLMLLLIFAFWGLKVISNMMEQQEKGVTWLRSLVNWVGWIGLLFILTVFMAMLGGGSYALAAFVFTVVVGMAAPQDDDDITEPSLATKQTSFADVVLAAAKKTRRASSVEGIRHTKKKDRRTSMPSPSMTNRFLAYLKAANFEKFRFQRDAVMQHEQDLVWGVVTITVSLVIGKTPTMYCCVLCLTVFVINGVSAFYGRSFWDRIAWVKQQMEQILPEMPGPVKQGVKTWLRGDAAIVRTVKRSLHELVSAFLIIMYLVVVVGGPVIIIIKVQTECTDMAKMISTQIPTLLENEEVKRWLPQGLELQEMVNTNTELASEYARDYAQNQGEQMFGEKFNWTEIESGVKEVWSSSFGEHKVKCCNGLTAVSQQVWQVQPSSADAGRLLYSGGGATLPYFHMPMSICRNSPSALYNHSKTCVAPADRPEMGDAGGWQEDARCFSLYTLYDV
jgi:hypothetical protein